MSNSLNINRYYPPSHKPTEINGNLNELVQQNQPQNGVTDSVTGEKFEVPLPFGYHLDLDFLRVCSDETVSEETLQKLKDLRKTKRKRRKTLEALMGIKQEQKERDKHKSLSLERSFKLSPPKTLNLTAGHISDQPDIVNSSELVREALRESMISFQETLDQYKEDSPGPSNICGLDLLNSHVAVGATSTPKDKFRKFSTSPRYVGSPTDEGHPNLNKSGRQMSNSSISSISTSSSALPYSAQEAYLASLPSNLPQGDQDDMETFSIGSIDSEMSTQTLRNIREQMARSLVKLKEYEKQVEAIPVLQVKLSVLKEDKRLLMLKLKATEAKLRRERGESYDGGIESHGLDEAMDTDDEDMDSRVLKMSRSNDNGRRARSESPFAKFGTIHPEEFISYQHRKKSISCGFNSDSSDISPTAGGRKYYSKESSEFDAEKARLNRADRHQSYSKADIKEATTNTDMASTRSSSIQTMKLDQRDKGSNTEPDQNTTRMVNHGTNTYKVRSIPKGTGTDLRMRDIMGKEEVESRIQDAVFRTEEEIMSCPLLQKAMQKVEEEALRGPTPEKQLSDIGCQVGLENLRPFVIDIGISCNLESNVTNSPDKTLVDSWCQVAPASPQKVDMGCGMSNMDKMNLMKTIGVGECKIIEEPQDPTSTRTVGVGTEKWVEIIRASKQTDTEDFAFKDTESPRVADIIDDYYVERPERKSQRISSLTSACMRKSSSPSVSRRSSTNSASVSRKSSEQNSLSKTDCKSKGTMTVGDIKMKQQTVDTGVGEPCPIMKSIGTSAILSLPLSKSHLPPGSPISTPETDKPPVNMNLCDKCEKDIHQVAEGIISGPPLSPVIAPPSPDQPWVSKIPRPVENPDVSRLKSATSTGNLYGPNNQRSQSPLMQRSKSNLEPSALHSFSLPGSSKTPPPQRRDVGTPPPHPKSPAPGMKRAFSPLARSASASMMSSYTASTDTHDKSKSLIPKYSPSIGKKTSESSGEPQKSKPTLTKSDSKSLIPRVATPPALRKMFPKSNSEDKNSSDKNKSQSDEKNVGRKRTYSRGQAGVNNPDLDKIDEHPKTDLSKDDNIKTAETLPKKASGADADSGEETETLDDDKTGSKVSSFPLPGAALFAPIDDNRTKLKPSKEMKAALKVLNDSLSRGVSRSNAQVTNAVNIIQQEWFKTSSTKQSNPLDVEDYLDSIEEMSKELLSHVVNLTDVNGNTALHYSVSHGNFDVVSILLDSKVANCNILNKAGYTCSMLISLAVLANETHRAVVNRLFSTSDLNLRASQHGQTALMLAVSHGRLDMVELLVEAGADLNIRDEDGSTALMCAAEHGHLEIVKYLLQHPDINIGATDNDGLSALSVAMEAGYRDIGVLLYANMSFSRGHSPHSSMRMKKTPSRGSVVTPTGQEPTGGQATATSPVPPTAPHRSRRNSSNT